MFFRKDKIIDDQNTLINALLCATEDGISVTFINGSNNDLFHREVDIRFTKGDITVYKSWSTYSDEDGLANEINESVGYLSTIS